MFALFETHSFWRHVSLLFGSFLLFIGLGEIQWIVLSSDISNVDETRRNLVFCDFQPATWYQLKVSAVNDAGKTTALYNIATTKINGGNHNYYNGFNP